MSEDCEEERMDELVFYVSWSEVMKSFVGDKENFEFNSKVCRKPVK